MSHRKFEAPRHGSLAFLPRKRSSRAIGKIKAFPKDDPSKEPHFTGFVAWKAGMTHVLRKLDGRPGSPLQKKEIINAVTILDCPDMIVAGIVGYKQTPFGLKATRGVWANALKDEFLRCHYKNWHKCARRKFSVRKPEDQLEALEGLKKANNVVIRAVCYGERCPIKKRKKTWIKEFQINGGTIEQKIDFVWNLLEKTVSIEDVFEVAENIDTIAVTKGRGMEGVTHRWGVTRLPRKTHRGLRKVACIGAWHPARVSYAVARVGQNGYHHRTEINKKIFHIGKNAEIQCKSGDLTKKSINPMGGFVHYGTVRDKYLMIKGSCPGLRKRPITLRKILQPLYKPRYLEPIDLKFVDTSSKFGHGRFQTDADKRKFMGPTKKHPKG